MFSANSLSPKVRQIKIGISVLRIMLSQRIAASEWAFLLRGEIDSKSITGPTMELRTYHIIGWCRKTAKFLTTLELG